MAPGYAGYAGSESSSDGARGPQGNSYCCQIDKQLQTLLHHQVEQARAEADDAFSASAHLPPPTYASAAAIGDHTDGEAPLSPSDEVADTTPQRPTVTVSPYSDRHYAQHPLSPGLDTPVLPRRVYVPALITIADADKSGDSHASLGGANGDGPSDSNGGMSGSMIDSRLGSSGSGHANGSDKPGGSSSSSGYIVYIVRVGDKWEVRHRYSEFESLRRALQRLYPTLIIPPIPEKHSLTQYAVLQSRTKDEPGTIARRKRMLQTFLNRLVRHPILASEHILHRFLEPGVAWSEVLHSPCLTNLPKNPLHLSPSCVTHRATATSGAAAGHPDGDDNRDDVNIRYSDRYRDDEEDEDRHATDMEDTRSHGTGSDGETTGTSWADSSPRKPLHSRVGRKAALAPPPNPQVLLSVPIPSGLQPLRQPDPRWVECEYFTNRFASTFHQSIERQERRVAKKWAEIALDYAELGAVYNGFSLTEVDALAGALEKVGQAVDSTFMATNRMVGQLEADVTEPLHEYSQMAGEIKQVLKYRNLKHLQLEHVSDSLQRKRDLLDDLEIADLEARRLNQVLERDESVSPTTPQSTRHRIRRHTIDEHDGPDRKADAEGENDREAAGEPDEAHRPRAKSQSQGPADDPFEVNFSPTLGHPDLPQPGGDDPWKPVGYSSTTQDDHPFHFSNHEADHRADPLHADDDETAADQPTSGGHGTRSEPTSPKPGSSTHLHTSTPLTTSATEPLSKSSIFPSGSTILPPKRTTLGSSLIHRLSYKFHGVIDVDPQATRRNTMTKTKDQMAILEEQQELLTNDLALINSAVQLDLDQFQRQKVRDLRDILLAMAKIHIEWARKNKEAWVEVRDEVNQIPNC
ncbi:Sorting nexin, cytoplasm-to-vacuole targeting pathway/endosomal sorting [Dimargaris cristalligena]|nr:Sorting nexin, cytoplasm-to-vacuole targeting pathway/endosomal sorting [Dimargaris cristalligena]